MGNEYNIVDYRKILGFDTITNKLKKKLLVKQDIIIAKLALEKRSSNSDDFLMGYMQAEVDLINHIIEIKKIKG